jgi:hypothetical protein
MTVRLVDRFYNLITANAIMPTVALTSNDNGATTLEFFPKEITLANGVQTATLTFVTQNNPFSNTTNPNRNQKGWQVTGSDDDFTNLYENDISTWVVTWPNDPVKLRVLASNQQAVEGSSPTSSGIFNDVVPVAGKFRRLTNIGISTAVTARLTIKELVSKSI